ncbi:MAG: alkaline phosphatase family protein [Planctomycetota bacterium]
MTQFPCVLRLASRVAAFLLISGVSRAAPQEEDLDPVRLVVLLSVDQMIPEQFERLAPQLEGGLGRLLREGTYYRDAHLPYARTETGAGHVTLSTGCLPRTHGVVGNSFWDRTEGRERYCVEDVNALAVRAGGAIEGEGRRSPLNLLRPTLGEILQIGSPESRVVSISSKDRAAIGMAGKARGLVLWWDKGGTGFQTSTGYGEALPDFVTQWNEDWLGRYRGWVWEPLGNRTERDFELVGAAADQRDGERPLAGLGTSFPYPFPKEGSAKAIGGFAFQSPLCDQFVCDLGREAARQEQLGADDDVDLLCLSFSSCDVVGHANGPYSREVTDVLFRLDKALGSLFDELDARVGEDRWVAALTADHGVLPLPEYLEARGIDARRIDRDDVKAFRGAFIERLRERLGARVRHRSAPGGYQLDAEEIESAGLRPAEARLAAAEVLRGLRGEYDWIGAAYAMEEVAAFGEDSTGVKAMLRNSFHPDRTADVVIVHAPNVLVGMANGTSHGSPHAYDRHVPMIFMGAPFPAVVSSRTVGSQDIVPTLLGVLGLESEPGMFDGVDLLAR